MSAAQSMSAAMPSLCARPRPPRALWALTALAAVGVLAGVILALVYAGQDVRQGEVQRLFYVHLSSFVGAFAAFGAAALGSLLYLLRRRQRWDVLALSAVEVGFVMSLINVCLGSIWARPTWNTWWTGDPRMIASAAMMLLCVAYLVLRQGFEDGERRRQVSAVLGVALMAAVVVTTIVTRLRPDTIHPVVIGPSPQNTQAGMEMSQSMALTLAVNVVAWGLLLTPALIAWRCWLEAQAARRSSLRIVQPPVE